MTFFQPGANVYTQGFGSRPENVEVPHLDVRPPTSSDINAFYPIGKHWIDTVGLVEYTLVGQTSIGGVLSAIWDTGGLLAATQTTLGSVFLATLAQTEAGGAPSASYVSSANDVAAALSALVVGAGVPATTLQQGYVFLATNAQAAA